MVYPWSDLNPELFEELAKSYLEDLFPEESWKLLPRSGDGNRDVESSSAHDVFGTRLTSTHWAEAKFTKNGKRALSKGQLDPTVVSAMLDRSVRALMFLTNSRFPDSYILRAQQVLRQTLQGGVHFIDKEHIEEWLDRKPGMVTKYFSGVEPLRPASTGQRPKLISAQLLSCDDFFDGHWEKRKAVLKDEELILALIVSVTDKMKIAVKLEASGLELKPTPQMPANMQLRCGRHIVPVPVKARQMHPNGKATVSLFDQAGDRHSAATFHYSVGPEDIRLSCSGQLKASQRLHDALRQFRDTPLTGCISLSGGSGDGKSYILREIRQNTQDQSTHLHQFNEPGRNARELCRSLLFTLFGAGSDLKGLENGGRKKTMDFPQDLIASLHEGARDATKAQDVLETLVSGGRFEELLIHHPRGDNKVVIFDDVQKADQLSLRVLTRWLEILQNSKARLMVVLAQHPNFKELDNALRPILVRSIFVKRLTQLDIQAELSHFLKPSVLRVVLPEVRKLVRTVLELRYLVSELRANTELMHLPEDVAVSEFRSILVSASIPEVAARIQTANVEEAADLVALLDTGVPEDYLVQQFGEEIVDELIDSELFSRRREEIGAPASVVSSHDLLRAAYLKRRSIYSDSVASHIERLLDRDPQRINELLGHLCLCGGKWSRSYFPKAINACSELLRRTQFGSAKLLSFTLNQLIEREDVRELGLTPDQHVSIAYGYADCVNHTEGSGCAKRYFEATIQLAEAYRGDKTVVPNVCKARSELLNLRFWQHDLDNFQTSANNLLNELDSLKFAFEPGPIVDAKLTTLNRLMMVHYLQDSKVDAEAAFHSGLAVAEQNALKHESAHLLMDRGKSLILVAPAQALKELMAAKKLYLEAGNQQRRLMVCKAQIAYLQALLNQHTPTMVEALAKDLQDAGFEQEYANCLLQISALYLIADRCEEATKALDEISRLKNALNAAPRRQMLYFHLRGIIEALNNGSEAATFMDAHLELTNDLGASYQDVAIHNLSLIHKARSVSWAFNERGNNFQIDPRLW
ncbi:hypothetical protein F9L33_09665 [Amylibacter sp. SFDW26]|uniref:ATP-binding protein n=1 Tax=Amylibacter sp. SFDW26 TaxID=2652722 RepID=UPI00126250EA|nr:hypothetical protein [Amylibacter sp. SFDW26]KAB7613636.1 hypothetical protein F9L33_09665 [Amylibacter sp. SFDW26]